MAMQVTRVVLALLLGVATQSVSAEELRGAATPVEALSAKQQQEIATQKHWVHEHIEKLQGKTTLPVAAIGSIFLVPIFCLIAMHAAKPVKNDATSGCSGWGPCFFFGGITFVLWVYFCLLGFDVFEFKAA